MKKQYNILIILSMLSLLSISSFAQYNQVNTYNNGENKELQINFQNQYQNQNFEMLKNKNEQLFTYCKGECQVELKQTNIEKQTNEYQIRNKARFLFFNVELEKNIETDFEGNILSENNNFWQWLYERNN